MKLRVQLAVPVPEVTERFLSDFEIETLHLDIETFYQCTRTCSILYCCRKFFLGSVGVLGLFAVASVVFLRT